MNKKDLSTGMVVKLRNGDVGVVINNFISGQDCFYHLNQYDDDFSAIYRMTQYDIIEVYQYENTVYNDGSRDLKGLLKISSSHKKIWFEKQFDKVTTILLNSLKERGFDYVINDSSYAKHGNLELKYKGKNVYNVAENIVGNFESIKKGDVINIDDLLKGERHD